MRVIIAGSRTIEGYSKVVKAVADSTFVITSIVSGCAKGADRLGELYALLHQLPCTKFPADWDKHGKSAGYKRNVVMSENADALIALWDGTSKGTGHMIGIMTKANKPVFVYKI